MLVKKKLGSEINTLKLFKAKSIFINDDLTETRLGIASQARKMKRENKIQDTWTRDGVIYVKAHNGHVKRVTTLNGLEQD